MRFNPFVLTAAVIAGCDGGLAIQETVLAVADASTTNDRGHVEAVLDTHRFVFIPEGTFSMGSTEGLEDERPVHDVELDAYWIAKFPVTVSQFREFVEATGYVTDAEKGWGSWQWTGEIPEEGDEGDPWRPMKDGAWNHIYFEQGDDHPVGSVSWNDAQAYCAWLSDELGVPVVLPTEAQWENAARGEAGSRFPWGDAVPDGERANYADARFIGKYGPHARRPDPEVDDGYVETSPVGAYDRGQSAYGVYDMAGNLGEWVYDVYDPEYYARSPSRNPTGPERPPGLPDEAIDRVNRGGSWVDWAGVTKDGVVQPEGGHSVRSAARTGDEQNSSDDHMGFRVAIDGLRSAEPSKAASDKPDLTGVEILTQSAGGNVYMLEATGDVAGNIAASVGSDGVLIVDDQWAELTDAITAALRELDSGGLRFIINTHHHDDHSDGNANLVSETGAIVVAHARARARLLQKNREHWPVVTFSQVLNIHFNGEDVRALSVPGGHTDNDVVVFFAQSNVVHMGDLFNSGMSSFPVVDFDAGGDALKTLENIELLLPLIPDGATVIPGHGPLSNKDELFRLRDMLDETITLVRDQKASGKTLEEITAAGLGPKYESWGHGYMPEEGWIDAIFRSLDAE